MKNYAKLRRSLALLLILALVLPFVRLPAASASFAPLYDTINYDNPPSAPAYRSLPSGSYVAAPFRINNAYGEISAVMLNAKYENTSRPTVTKAKMSVAIFADDGGKPGAMLAGAVGSYELEDQVDLGGQSNPFSLFYISLEEPAKLYRDRQYWIVYGTTDADAARASLVGVNEQPLSEQQGTNNYVADLYQPARVEESSRVIYSLQDAGSDIAGTDWSGAQRTDGQILPFVLNGWVSEPHENLSVQFATDTMARVFFGPSADATEVVLEQSEDEGATWTVANAGPLDQYSNDATVTGLKPETAYWFRLVVKDGSSGGISNTGQITTLPDSGWRLVGEAGFSGQLVRDTELVLDAAGIPYIAYVDQAMTGKIIVKKFTGAAWASVGAEATDEQASSVSLALDGEGRPYIAYTAVADSLLTVRKFDGTAWTTVGQAGIGEGDLPDLKLDAANRPYVAYRDLAGPLGGAITVSTFADGSWQPAGAAQFTPETSVQRLSLAIGKDGVPYVGYFAVPDGSYNSYKPFVYRLAGGAWTDIGYSGFGTPHSASVRISLAASPVDGAIYAVFDDTNVSRMPSVIRWNGSDWDAIGSPGIAPRADSLRIAVDSQGVPYVAYSKRNEGGGPVSVLRWSGTAWENVGGADFSGGAAYDISLAIDAGEDLTYPTRINWKARIRRSKYIRSRSRICPRRGAATRCCLASTSRPAPCRLPC